MPSLPGQSELELTCSRARLHGRTAQPGDAVSAGKPTLVFLHFFGGSSRSWEPVLAELGLEFSCVALDLRGFGSTVVTEADGELSSYSLDLMAADVVEAVNQLGLKDYVLVAHSMGGKVALAFAAGYGYPPGLRALALVAPSPPTPEPMADKERARLLASHGSVEAARETIAKSAFEPVPPALETIAVEDEVRVALPAWRAWLERGTLSDISERLKRIEVPVYVLAGEKDENITPSLLRRVITGQLPSEYAHDPETVPDAAHLIPFDAPGAVADFVRRAASNGR